MRKQTKIAAITSAAALLAIGASMTAFAAWVGDTTGGTYYDKDGEPASGWHRWIWDGGNEMCCADDDGRLIQNSYVSLEGEVDDFSAATVYYVGADGVRLKDQWLSADNDDEMEFVTVNDESYVPETLYRYVDGLKVIHGTDYTVKDVKKTNSTADKGKFLFNEDGYMMEGLVTDADGNEYYCVTEDDLLNNEILVEGPNGSSIGIADAGYVEGQALVGWAKFPNVDDFDEYESSWRYYDSGKRIKDTKAHSLKWNGQTSIYYFSTAGNMTTDVATTSATMSDATGNDASMTFRRFNTTDGVVTAQGWYSVDEDSDGELEWYYLVNVRDYKRNQIKGVVFNAQYDSAGKLVEDGLMRAKNINGKVFIFDSTGKMLDDMVTVEPGVNFSVADKWCGIACDDLGLNANSGKKTFYFYGEQENSHRGEMQTGKITYTDNDEELVVYVDPDKGLMKSAIINGYLYDADGNLYKALDFTREAYKIGSGETINVYTVKKNKVVVDDGYTSGISATTDGKQNYIIVNGSGKATDKKGDIEANGDEEYTLNGFAAQKK